MPNKKREDEHRQSIWDKLGRSDMNDRAREAEDVVHKRQEDDDDGGIVERVKEKFRGLGDEDYLGRQPKKRR